MKRIFKNFSNHPKLLNKFKKNPDICKALPNKSYKTDGVARLHINVLLVRLSRGGPFT